MNKCKQCNKEIEQIEGKKSRIYCSDACRMKHNRTLKNKSEQPKTPIPNKLHQNSSQPANGYCHSCGKKENHPDLCICPTCIAKDISHESLGLDIELCS